MVLGLMACGNELFDAANRAADGYTFVYAVLDNATERRVLITDGNSFSKEMTISGMPFGTASPSELCVDNDGRIFASYWDGVWVYNGSSGWTFDAPAPSGTVMDLVANDGEVVALAPKEGNINVYRYESNSGTPWMLDKTVMADVVGMARSSDDEQIYLYSGGTNIYNYSDLSVADTFSAGSTPIFLDRRGGVFFIGTSGNYMRVSENPDVTISLSPRSMHSYTQISPSLVYASGMINGQVGIARINLNDDSIIDLATPGFGSVGISFIEHLDSTTLVVGINASAGFNGLWIYKTDTGALSQISPVPVYGLFVRR